MEGVFELTQLGKLSLDEGAHKEPNSYSELFEVMVEPVEHYISNIPIN